MVVGLAMLIGCSANLPDRPSARSVQREADRWLVGWRGVANTVAEDKSLRTHVLTQICSGDAEWVGVASRLLPTVYAHLNEELSSALAVALLHSPAEVLRVLHPDVCQVPDDLPPACDVAHWRKRAEAALASVADTDLQKAKQQCENVLRTGK